MRVYNHIAVLPMRNKGGIVVYTVLTSDYHVVMNFSDEHLDIQC